MPLNAYLRAARFRVAFAVCLSVLLSCGKSEPPLVATTLALSTQSVTLDAIGATQTVTVTVNDQKGGVMTNAAIAWTSNAPGIVSVSGTSTATATAVTNGTATLTATVGALTKTVSVTVAQAALAPQKTAGDVQAGTVGAALSTQLSVKISDRLGNGIAGRVVTFTPVTGGTTAPASPTTTAAGVASSTWTLGNVAGPQVVTVTVSGGTESVSFTATAAAGAATTLSVNAGNNQVGPVGTAVPIAPSVRVTDAFGNVKAGVAVTFTPSAGSGSVTGGTATSDAAGIATVGSWVLGATIGSKTLVASSPGLTSATFTASAGGGTPTTVVASAGATQSVAAGANAPIAPAVRVTDATGAVLANVSVTFAVASGGGSITGATTTTNASGVATVGSWTTGSTPGANTLTATVAGAGITGNPVTFTTTGITGSGTYNVDLRFLTTGTSGAPIAAPTPSQTAAFNSAAARWQAIITADLGDIPLVRSAGACGSNSPAINETIDDLVIFVTLETIDGAGGVLGSAGPCTIRSANFLPVTGRMRFDVADLAQLEASGRLEAVILHEMGHILGIGTIWDFYGLVADPSLPSSPGVDTRFTGSNAIVGFNAVGGATYTGGGRVPVENAQGGSGTQDSHWRENVLVNELMTGFINAGSNPLSILTIRSLLDIGYIVNTSQADSFTLTLGALRGTPANSVQMINDLTRDPIDVVDERGRFIRTIRPR
jgi:hypothetical protein